MKVIIAGSRGITQYTIVQEAIDEAFKKEGIEITEVVSGTAKGVDQLGEVAAELNDIPIKQFPAEWSKYGRSAGFVRNGKIADDADVLIACVANDRKGGTEDTIGKFKKGVENLYLV